MILEDNKFYVIENFEGLGTNEYGDEKYKKNISVILWSGNWCGVEIQNKVVKIREANELEKEFYIECIDEGPTKEDYVGMSLCDFEDWKKNKENKW